MDLSHALAFSRYAERALAAHPQLAEWLPSALEAPVDWDAAANKVPQDADAATLALWLRQLRRRVFLQTMLRDLTRRADLREVCGAMTALADLAIGAAVARHAADLTAAHGSPIGLHSGAPQSLIVAGMGKLGGGELNVSSDIDLVFVYPEEGETDGARPLANREFFDRLGRRVINTLHDVSADGYVFRVDMRLRPYGASGPLTTSFVGLEQYLVTQGRAWERYAWLKARAITGTRHDELYSLVTPFVYRKYLDYDAYEGLRDIHRQIRDQSARRAYADNVKLGDGGIREIEFIAQALQIVRGGRERDLRVRGTLPALAAIEARGLLPPSSCEALRDAYFFLRNVEHRLQYRDDEQTHDLPGDGPERALLAASLDTTPEAFARVLERHRGLVSVTFARTLGDDGRDSGEADAQYVALWEDPVPAADAQERLRASGFADPEALIATLARVRGSSRYQQLPAVSRQRVDALVPQLLAVAAENPGLAGAQVVFERLFSLLETIARRSAYLALVIEHPPLLPRLANLMGASAWAADYLTRHPLLLDELLDARVLLAEPDWDAWRAELARLLDAHPEDAEHQMDVLRHFQHAQSFRLLVQDLEGRLTVERLADHLSALADVVLDAALRSCWRNMTGDIAGEPHFAIIGYGKLGGKELGYASDLDLVFLFDRTEDDPDAYAKETRYTRLAQRLNTWLTSTTAAGQLYDTDLRLRPDGAKGLLVSSFRSFRKYQRSSAWQWEHQALTRARFVAGDPDVGTAFEAERDAILRLPRDVAQLREDVVTMRRKIHAGHQNPSPAFDLKHDAGGMVDIEFTVQYLVLAHAHAHPILTRNAGNIALLGFAGDLGLVPAPLARAVADAYREYRRLQHKVRLTGAAHARVDPAPQAERRAAVAALWLLVFGAPWRDGAPAPPASA
jgi:[glutamine synthetase] adenylyltransferase / [glutamine synthetase]-adenylyl-L-tyrosine phosphorylase